MKMEKPKSITEICKMLDITSRTVRYYEQCGLIKTVRESRTAPRRLDSENTERLRKIRFLKYLGLSLEEIAVIIDNEEKAADIVLGKAAEISAEIRAMKKRITLLQDVLTVAEQGGDIYSVGLKKEQREGSDENLRIAAGITRLFLERRFSEIAPYCRKEMQMLPPEYYEANWDMVLKPCGAFRSFGEQIADGSKITNILIYEKLSLAVNVWINGGVVTGILLNFIKNEDGTMVPVQPEEMIDHV